MLPSSRLITFPVSHYCEKARWALERLDIPYIEERHAPLFHLMATRRVGGSSVPVLILDGKVLTDSTEILKYLNTIAPDDGKLYPSDPEFWSTLYATGVFGRLSPRQRLTQRLLHK